METRLSAGFPLIVPTLLDPVAAYDRLAPDFAAISERRRAYLLGVERLVTGHLRPHARSLLDIGSGDGRRAARIAQAGNIPEVTLLEPSAAMREAWPPGVTAWPIRAEELASKRSSFDVIICLWNVLGHIFPQPARLQVLRDIARLLLPGGQAFVDVSHRYNVRHYGFAPTVFRMLKDQVVRDEAARDVAATWTVSGESFSTRGHVFSHGECLGLFKAAGLRVVSFTAVDYKTGEPASWLHGGHLLYQLARET